MTIKITAVEAENFAETNVSMKPNRSMKGKNANCWYTRHKSASLLDVVNLLFL